MKTMSHRKIVGGRKVAGDDLEMFIGGPPLRLQRRLGLVGPGHPNTACRMGLAVLLAWAPLAVLSMLHGWQATNAFFYDFNSHARFLIAIPLFIAAESACLPRLSMLAENFRTSGLVAVADYGLFNKAVATVRLLLNSVWVEVVLVVIAYAMLMCAYASVPFSIFPDWAKVTTQSKVLTPAGWWVLLISLPLLVLLMLGWMWRLCLWTYFLWAMSRLNLRLVTVHPDGAAGLGFVGYSLQAFMVLALAIGTLVAGGIAGGISEGTPFSAYHFVIAGLVGSIVLVLNLPAFVFTHHLLQTWRRASLEYGALADHFGREFERKWLNRGQQIDASILEQPDFSAATDLYQIVDRSYSMWLVPIHMRSVGLLAVAVLLPFVPVALLTVPFDTIVDKLAHLLF